MGIKKIGDRVRIFVAIKQLRNKTVANRKQKNMVRLIHWSSGNLYILILHRSNWLRLRPQPSRRWQTLASSRLTGALSWVISLGPRHDLCRL